MTTIAKNGSENIEVRPVASVLRNMQISDNEIFSIRQMDTVRNTINRIKIYSRLTNEKMEFTTKTDGILFKVTRIA